LINASPRTKQYTVGADGHAAFAPLDGELFKMKSFGFSLWFYH
jgi:hypothetical protein